MRKSTTEEKISVFWEVSDIGDCMGADYVDEDGYGVSIRQYLDNPSAYNEENDEWEYPESNYEDLKKMVIQEAGERDVDINRLVFWYDDDGPEWVESCIKTQKAYNKSIKRWQAWWLSPDC